MKKLWILFLLVFFALGCNTAPVYQIRYAPVSTDASGDLKPIDQVSQAIMSAASQRGWTPVLKEPGLIQATLMLRNHRATVDITYSQTDYNILYQDSTNLDYDGKNIHRNYNNWIVKLSKSIQKELNKLN